MRKNVNESRLNQTWISRVTKIIIYSKAANRWLLFSFWIWYAQNSETRVGKIKRTHVAYKKVQSRIKRECYKRADKNSKCYRNDKVTYSRVHGAAAIYFRIYIKNCIIFLFYNLRAHLLDFYLHNHAQISILPNHTLEVFAFRKSFTIFDDRLLFSRYAIPIAI